MDDFLRIDRLEKANILGIFALTERIEKNAIDVSQKLRGLHGVSFFPDTSLRTRVSFDVAISRMGGSLTTFSSDVLNKKEAIEDVARYISNWSDFFIIRHPNYDLIKKFSTYSSVPVINAMTEFNHPCEILGDMYALEERFGDISMKNFIYIGAKGNIGNSWAIASEVYGFHVTQICPKEYEIEPHSIGISGKNFSVTNELESALSNADIILTDSWPEGCTEFQQYKLSLDMLESICKKNVVINPCPPITRGNEFDEAILNTKYFVGFDFKKSLVPVQQAILLSFL